MDVETRVQKRDAGRAHAKVVLSLINELHDPESLDACWQFILNEALIHSSKPKTAVASKAEPMTDVEAKRYETISFMFGKHIGIPIGQVAVKDPEYLDWFARTVQDEPNKSINRYLLWRQKKRKV